MLPPLQFKPLFKRYLWGGRRLATTLGKSIGSEDAAESWELVDHGQDQSVVSAGPLTGKTLRYVVKEHSQQLFGRHAPQAQFPLLLKYLDAQRTLSVQVHPNDSQGALLDPPDLGKTEAWVVLAANPGSKIYAGLKQGIDSDALRDAVANGTCEECLHAFEPKVGDCVFIAAGTIHALGEGLVIAEIQQASNTTFRLFDWNRVDKDGQPRPLHVEQAVGVTDFARGPVSPQTPVDLGGGRQQLVECDKFLLERRTFSGDVTLEPDGRFRIVTLIQGTAELRSGSDVSVLSLGSTLLLPAEREVVQLCSHESSIVLEMMLP